jgi:hypothetical protein
MIARSNRARSSCPTCFPILLLETVVILSTMTREALRSLLRPVDETRKRISGASVRLVVKAQTIEAVILHDNRGARLPGITLAHNRPNLASFHSSLRSETASIKI